MSSEQIAEFIHAPKIGDRYRIDGRMEITVFRDEQRHKSLKVEIEHGTFSVTRPQLTESIQIE